MSSPLVFQWFLRVKGETSLPREIVLDAEPITFGRDAAQATYALREQNVSRRHAQIQVDTDGTVLVRDLGSANGTFVSGMQIHGAVTVRHGDEICIGRWRFEVQRVEVEAKVYKNRLPGRESVEVDSAGSTVLEEGAPAVQAQVA